MQRNMRNNWTFDKLKYIPPSKRKIKVAIYIRVSTHHQIDRESLPFQRQELENYCRYVLGILEYVIFEDAGYSAKNTDRPDYQEMMSRVRQGEFTHLLVWKLDRISRNLRDFTELWDEIKEYGVTFVSKMEQFDTSSAMGEAMLRIILVFAELERKLTAERVFGIMLSRAEKALWNGARVPLGFDWDQENKTVKINNEEAELTRHIFDIYEEYQSAQTVAKWLEENGKNTKRGGIWGSKGVIDILRNPIYIGVYRWNYRQSARGALKPEDEVITVENALPAIISREQWERVQKLLDANYKGRRDKQRQGKYIHILSGLIRCGFCGKTYLASKQSKAHKNKYFPSYYRCGTYVRNMQCRNKSISGLYIEPFILEYLCAYIRAARSAGTPKAIQKELLSLLARPEIEYIDLPQDDPGMIAVFGGMYETAATQSIKVTDDKLEYLKRQKQKIERALSRLDDTYYFPEGNNGITKTEYLVKKSEFQQRLAKVDNDISVMSSNSSRTPSMDLEFISRFLLLNNLYNAGNIRESLPDLDKQAVQGFLQDIISYAEVTEGRVTKIAFNSPRGEIVHRIIYKQSP